MYTYHACILIGAITGSLLRKIILDLIVTYYKSNHTITKKTAGYLRTYIWVKTLLTPIVFVWISIHHDLPSKEYPQANIIIDRILLNANGASGLLTPESHIIRLLIS